MRNWKPNEIIIHKSVKNDPATQYIISQCPGVPCTFVGSGASNLIKEKSNILVQGSGMMEQINAGKKVVYIAPPG